MLKVSYKRIINAFIYSLQGLKAAYRHEQAFKEETFILIISFVLAAVLPVSLLERILLIASVLFLMLIELLNSAIEAVVDRISEEKHELSGRAKDMGSAAVLLATILLIITWGYIIISYIYHVLN
ncbi:diacylglycerol kinase [Thorsellia kenyensis]|uniref:Diacylglycerol kinase n=1 Tax=Thorsellia kenyensis TaxID=1549888 RepID=A0ABV6C9M4_9GAMM